MIQITRYITQVRKNCVHYMNLRCTSVKGNTNYVHTYKWTLLTFE